MISERLRAGREAGSFAESADHDRRCGPAGRAGPGDRDPEQGDADVAEDRQRVERGDGAAVDVVEYGCGLGQVQRVDDGGRGRADAVLEQTTSEPSTPSTPPAIARRGARGASVSASQTVPATSKMRPVVLRVMPAIIGPR